MLKRCLTFSSQTSLCDIDLAYLKPWHPFLAHNLNGPWLIASLDILYTVCAQQHLLQYAHEHIHNSHTCTNKDNVESVSQRCEKGEKVESSCAYLLFSFSFCRAVCLSGTFAPNFSSNPDILRHTNKFCAVIHVLFTLWSSFQLFRNKCQVQSLAYLFWWWTVLCNKKYILQPTWKMQQSYRESLCLIKK